MKVLEHGDTYRIKICPVCHCGFEYSLSDVQSQESSNEYASYVFCPECGYCQFLVVYTYCGEKDETNKWNEQSFESTKQKIKKCGLE